MVPWRQWHLMWCYECSLHKFRLIALSTFYLSVFLCLLLRHISVLPLKRQINKSDDFSLVGALKDPPVSHTPQVSLSVAVWITATYVWDFALSVLVWVCVLCVSCVCLELARVPVSNSHLFTLSCAWWGETTHLSNNMWGSGGGDGGEGGVAAENCVCVCVFSINRGIIR